MGGGGGVFSEGVCNRVPLHRETGIMAKNIFCHGKGQNTGTLEIEFEREPWCNSCLPLLLIKFLDLLLLDI